MKPVVPGFVEHLLTALTTRNNRYQARCNWRVAVLDRVAVVLHLSTNERVMVDYIFPYTAHSAYQEITRVTALV